jgi:hypothetical protein
MYLQPQTGRVIANVPAARNPESCMFILISQMKDFVGRSATHSLCKERRVSLRNGLLMFRNEAPLCLRME